jgi:hypothetical protein
VSQLHQGFSIVGAQDRYFLLEMFWIEHHIVDFAY